MKLRFRFFVGEALASLRNNLATTLAATMTVLIVMFFLGVFVALGSYTYSYIENARHDLNVRVFLSETANGSQVDAVAARLRSNPDVKRVQYISKSQAKARARRELGKDVDLVPGNFLPAEFDVRLASPDHAKDVANSVKDMPGVEKKDGVKYGGQTADRFLRNTSIIEAVVGALILLLAVAAVLLIANTIRLSIFARRREIEVMKLVGATNWFVRLPFMLEGMLCGLGGALLSVLLLGGAYQMLLSKWLDSSTSGSLTVQTAHSLPFWVIAILLLAAGTALGAMGSGLTMRRFLRV
jgi:cell division transport system permease protein